MTSIEDAKVAIIGLGYVGLPLAVEFGKKYDTLGFDIKEQRIRDLQCGIDRTLEVGAEELASAKRLTVSFNPELLQDRNVFIVTVPTPIDRQKRPDFAPLISACKLIALALKSGNVVIFESTVYPGATEEVCVPVLEAESGLRYNADFFCGYSPERINPGDKTHRLTAITKITSGSTEETATFVDALYATIISAGTHRAPTIRVAEAAKVIENTQRDVNIALINELAMIFNRLDIDTDAVLQAAATKWNFLPFRPGLVGGHCIGVDPYYLTHKAQEVGYHPEVILSGRKINDGMGAYIAAQVIKLMTRRKIHVVDSSILVMGITFKENCPDVRNTRAIDIVRELQSYNAQVHICDPWADPDEVFHEYGLHLVPELDGEGYDGVVIAVGHTQFKERGVEEIRRRCKKNAIIYDVKHLFPMNATDGRL